MTLWNERNPHGGVGCEEITNADGVNGKRMREGTMLPAYAEICSKDCDEERPGPATRTAPCFRLPGEPGGHPGPELAGAFGRPPRRRATGASYYPSLPLPSVALREPLLSRATQRLFFSALVHGRRSVRLTFLCFQSWLPIPRPTSSCSP